MKCTKINNEGVMGQKEEKKKQKQMAEKGKKRNKIKEKKRGFYKCIFGGDVLI